MTSKQGSAGSSQIQEGDKEILNQFFSPQCLIYDSLKAGSIDGTDTIAHDKGISRALATVYNPPPITGNPEKTVFVARLSPKTTEQQLFKVFSEFGKVKSCKLVKCLVTGTSKRYAFVEYDERSEAMTAYRKGNKIQLDDVSILVDFECEYLLPNWIPRRLGGGMGGRKESGQLRFGCRDRPFRKPIPLLGKSNRYHKT